MRIPVCGHLGCDAFQNGLSADGCRSGNFLHRFFELLLDKAALCLLQLRVLQSFGQRGSDCPVECLAIWKIFLQVGVELKAEFKNAGRPDAAHSEFDLITRKINHQDADLVANLESWGTRTLIDTDCLAADADKLLFPVDRDL